MNFNGRFAVLIAFSIAVVSSGFTQSIPGDANLDGVVDSRDALILRQNWKTTEPSFFTVEIPNLPEGALPMRMVRIPAGTFLMGSPDTERGHSTNEGPVHQVTIGYSFYMSETEVTQAQWETLMGTNPSRDNVFQSDYGLGDNYPIYFVSWTAARDFTDTLNTLQIGSFRLPSEAEWEYACRAGTQSRFYFGNSTGCSDSCENCAAQDPIIIIRDGIPSEEERGTDGEEQEKGIFSIRSRSDYMWFCATDQNTSRPVRQLRPNAFGLYDMSGNVLEWCMDYYHADYTGAPTNGAPYLGHGDSRIYRGGAWGHSAGNCRSANRGGTGQGVGFYDQGLRVVLIP